MTRTTDHLLRGARRGRWLFLPPLTSLAAFSVVTWPWPIQMWTRAQAAMDSGMFIWGFWWMRHALGTLSWPLSTDHALAPAGVSLVFQTMHLQALVSVPLQLLMSVPVAYNVVGATAVVLAGVVTYLLARDMGLHRLAALLASFLFTASPHLAYRYGISGHMNLAQAMWIPLLLLVLRAYLRRPSAPRAALGGAVVAGAVYSDFTIALFALFLSGSYLLTVLLLRRVHVLTVLAPVHIAAAVLVFTVLAAPLLSELVIAARTGLIADVPGLGGSDYYRNEITALLLPNLRVEGFGHLGLAATIFASLAVVLERKRRPLVVGLGAAVVICAVLSLGPLIVVGETRLVPLPVQLHEGSTVSALMPFTWLQALFRDLRVPMRFLLLGALPLALLAGFGVQALMLRNRLAAVVLVLVLVPVALFEARSPVAHTADCLPAAYAPVAADARPEVIVVDIPFGVRTGFYEIGDQKTPPLIYATKHQKPVAQGFAARLSTEQLAAAVENPLYADIIALQEVPEGAGVPEVNPRAARDWARLANVGYVVLRYDTTAYEHLVAYLEEACFEEIVRDDERVTMRFECR